MSNFVLRASITGLDVSYHPMTTVRYLAHMTGKRHRGLRFVDTPKKAAHFPTYAQVIDFATVYLAVSTGVGLGVRLHSERMIRALGAEHWAAAQAYLEYTHLSSLHSAPRWFPITWETDPDTDYTTMQSFDHEKN